MLKHVGIRHDAFDVHTDNVIVLIVENTCVGIIPGQNNALGINRDNAVGGILNNCHDRRAVFYQRGVGDAAQQRQRAKSP
jgi:hypothetical protein